MNLDTLKSKLNSERCINPALYFILHHHNILFESISNVSALPQACIRFLPNATLKMFMVFFTSLKTEFRLKVDWDLILVHFICDWIISPFSLLYDEFSSL